MCSVFFVEGLREEGLVNENGGETEIADAVNV